MQTAEFKMMKGTEGNNDYMVFARRGNIALGIKPLGLVNGGWVGGGALKTSTYFGARIRSAPAGDLFEAEDGGNNVVKFGEKIDLQTAWPDVTWEKADATRASTSVGVFLRGVITEEGVSPELMKELESGDVWRKMAVYLGGLAGADHMLMTERELAKWLQDHYQPFVDKVVAKIEKSKKVEHALSETIGSFGMQAAILKKVYETTCAESDDHVEDADD